MEKLSENECMQYWGIFYLAVWMNYVYCLAIVFWYPRQKLLFLGCTKCFTFEIFHARKIFLQPCEKSFKLKTALNEFETGIFELEIGSFQGLNTFIIGQKTFCVMNSETERFKHDFFFSNSKCFASQ